MVALDLKQEILQRVDTLTPEDQLRVLSFTESLHKLPQGMTKADLLSFGGTLSSDEAEKMRRDIEEAFEQEDGL